MKPNAPGSSAANAKVALLHIGKMYRGGGAGGLICHCQIIGDWFLPENF